MRHPPSCPARLTPSLCRLVREGTRISRSAAKEAERARRREADEAEKSVYKATGLRPRRLQDAGELYVVLEALVAEADNSPSEKLLNLLDDFGPAFEHSVSKLQWGCTTEEAYLAVAACALCAVSSKARASVAGLDKRLAAVEPALLSFLQQPVVADNVSDAALLLLSVLSRRLEIELGGVLPISLAALLRRRPALSQAFRAAIAVIAASVSPAAWPTAVAAQAAPPRATASAAELLDHLREALAAVQADAPLLSRLAAAEARLLEQRCSLAFDELGQGSLMQFAASHEEQLGLAALSSPAALASPGAALIRADVLATTRQVAAAAAAASPHEPLNADAVASAVAAHFGTAEPRLGLFESNEALLSAAEAAREEARPACAAALAFDGTLAQDAAAGPLGALSQADAAAALNTVLPLEDVGASTHWRALFQPSLSALSARILAGAGRPMLETAAGAFVPLPAHATVASFAAALGALDAREAAAHLCALAAQAGHARLAPVALLRSHVAASGFAASAGLVRDALCAVPEPLRAALGAPVFLAPFLEATPQGEERLLAACAAGPAQLAMLHSLGWKLGVKAWVDDLRARLFTSPQALEPALEPSRLEIQAAQPAVSAVPPAAASASAETPPTVTAPSAAVEGANTALCADIARGYGFALEAGRFRSVSDREDVSNLQRGYGRATQRLAAELYASDVHFVLELVQNADDCAYQEGVTPTLAVSLTPSAVAFLSNEVGFSEANVRALCSIGESTKAKKQGYIGQKGIGFKSVFRVTRTPEVHSRGWNFSFDITEGGLGYILPQPIAPPPLWTPEQGTLIRLPLDSAGGGDVRAELQSRLDDLHPSLLLFLNRLRVLSVLDSASGDQRCMTRVDEEAGVVRIDDMRTKADGKSSIETERWLRVSAVLPVPDNVARAGITVTEVQLALPLLSRASLDAGPLPDQEVHAFLPLRSYGFRFLLQADWVVPSSREAVDVGSSFNQWVREQLPPLFGQAARSVVARAAALERPDDASEAELEEAGLLLDTLYRVIPLRGSVLEFFASSVAPILALLRRTPLVPVATGGIVAPPLAVIPPADASTAAACEPYLALLGLSFLSPRISLPRPAAAELGVRCCDATLALDMLDAASNKWAREGARLGESDQDWLIWALSTVSEDAALSDLLPRLSRLAVLPLESGELVSASSGELVELSGDGGGLASYAARATGVRVLCSAFMRRAEAQPGASRVIARLGVARVEGASFFEERVLPSLGAADTPNDALVPLLCFAKARYDATPAARKEALLAQLRAVQPRLLCSDGRTALPGNIHISAPYTSPNLAALAVDAGLTWPTVSSAYAGDNSGWLDFFLALGAREGVHVTEKQADWASPELDAMLAHVERCGSAAASALLLQSLTGCWEEDALAERLRAGDGESSFAVSLRTSAWLEATPVVGVPASLLRGDALFEPTPALRELFSDAVHFRKEQPALPATLLAALGVSSRRAALRYSWACWRAGRRAAPAICG